MKIYSATQRNIELEPELRRLQQEIWNLGSTVERAIGASVEVLHRRDPSGAQPLILLDHQVSKKRFAIEMDCLTLITARQPPQGDLCVLTAMLEIATELEHIGHYITDIARIHFLIVKVEAPLLELLTDIRRMATMTQDMLHRALEAFVNEDLAAANVVLADDQRVDVLHDQIYLAALTFIQGKPRKMVKQARYLSQIARNLERTADRVTNICEWIVFAATGELSSAGSAELTLSLYQEEIA